MEYKDYIEVINRACIEKLLVMGYTLEYMIIYSKNLQMVRLKMQRQHKSC